jgi:hypothetical protein
MASRKKIAATGENDPRKVDPFADQRAAARKARAEVKNSPGLTAPPTTEPPTPSEPTPPVDLADARRRKELALAVSNKNPITLPLPELYSYKMEVMDRRLDEVVTKVKQPILAAFSEKIKAGIRHAIDGSPECRQARQAQSRCINEIIDLMAPELPEGYAITMIEGEKGTVRIEYAPDQVGKRLPLAAEE